MTAPAAAMKATATHARMKLRISNFLRSRYQTRRAEKVLLRRMKQLCHSPFLWLAQIVVGGAHLWPRGCTVGIETFLGGDDNAAVLTHLDDVQAARGVLVHPVPALEHGDDAVDRAFDAERFAAAHARERRFLFEHACRRGCGTKVDPRDETDHALRAGCLA